jgi:hypothetical protein
MGDRQSGGRVAVLSSVWGEEHGEAGFVLRSLAGAISRVAPVDVLVPGRAGVPRPDGAFDLVAVGEPMAGRAWPAPELATWPEDHAPALALVDRVEGDVLRLVERFAPRAPVVALTTGMAVPDGVDAAWRVAAGPAEPDRPEGPLHEVGLHVPINPLAAKRRHNGLGFTDYVLVLGDRGPAKADPEMPSRLAAWLVARFPRRHVVVVEDAVATVWRSRSLRGRVAIDTRTDLWRLMAHALVMVDLRPGPLVARECVESLRFGTPVVVPAGTVAAEQAALGGGLWYRDVAELLVCVDAFGDSDLRDTLGAQGRLAANARYGDPARFVDRVRTALTAVTHE